MPTDDRNGLSGECKIVLESAREASVRSRSLVLLLAFMSVLTFIAWRNQYEYAWPRTHLRKAEAAVRYLCTGERERLRERNRETPLDKDCDVVRGAAYFDSAATTARGKAFAERMKFTLPQAKLHLQFLQQQYVTGSTITIPFLGIQTDVNEFGVIASSTLIVLSLFCFAARKEELTVRELFNIARRHK